MHLCTCTDVTRCAQSAPVETPIQVLQYVQLIVVQKKLSVLISRMDSADFSVCL